jgi:hypothetical protein
MGRMPDKPVFDAGLLIMPHSFLRIDVAPWQLSLLAHIYKHKMRIGKLTGWAAKIVEIKPTNLSG